MTKVGFPRVYVCICMGSHPQMYDLQLYKYPSCSICSKAFEIFNYMHVGQSLLYNRDLTQNNSIHSYNTRKCNDLHVTQNNFTHTTKGPHAMCTKLYNQLPAGLKCEDRILVFKKMVFTYLDEKCFYSINEYLSP